LRLLQPNFPFRPDRLPFFYGWLILAVATLGMLMSIPGQTMGVSVFTDPLMAATRLSRTQLSTAYLIGTLLSGFLLPYAGVFLDRFGARITIVLASSLLALTLCYLASVDRLIAGVGRLLGVDGPPLALALMVLGFFAVRFSGQGLLTLVSRQLIGKWFDRLRGLVAGVSQPFVSFGFAAAPLGLGAWIDVSGWRGAWLEIALIIGLGMSLLGWLFYRDTPEECGLRMDGRVANADDPTPAADPAEPEYTRAQALRTLAFWAVTFALATQGLSITAITFHIVDLGREAGIDRTAAVGIFPFVALVSVVTSLAIGWLTSRVRLQALFVFMMVAQVVGVAAVVDFGSLPMRTLAILGMGASGGCFAPLSTVALPRYYGRRHLGAITSFMLMWIVWGSAFGPSVFAVSRDSLGSYRTAAYVCALLPVIAIALLLAARTPPREPS
jgi:MFS family permease